MKLAAFLLPLALAAQTTVYLRSSAPAGVEVVGASNTTPVVIQTRTAHNFSAAWTVGVWGICSGSGPSTANGIRKVKAVIDATHFSITDTADVDIVGNGPYIPCTPAGSQGSQWTGKLTTYTLGPQPLGWLDGLNGPMYRKLALGTANGLTSLVVSGDVATVTTSYNNGMTTGDKVGIWGSGNTALNNSGNPYTVTVTSPTTFTFATSGVSNGTYSGSNNTCGPTAPPNDLRGGTQDCLRVSQLAWAGNPMWDSVLQDSAVLNTGTDYKSHFEGGSPYLPPGYNLLSLWGLAAVRFMVDPTNDQMLAATTYALNHIQFVSGVNWTVNEQFSQGGIQFSDQSQSIWNGVSWLYMGGAAYLSSAEKTTLLNKLYNDLDNPSLTACSKAHADTSTGHNKILASGAAASGTSNTITLAADPGHGNGYYVNNIIQITVDGNVYYGLVTGYVSATKVATIAGTWGATPSSGTAYVIYGTISIASAANGAVTTVTGYNTTFTTDVSVGDAVAGMNGWNSAPEQSLSYISAVTDDTHLAVVNSTYPSTGATPSMVWYLPKWTAGDCGLIWMEKHWSGMAGSQPILYPPNGGAETNSESYGPGEGSNNLGGHIYARNAADFAIAPDDSRAVRDLALTQSFGFDWSVRPQMNYVTGFSHSGGYYDGAVLTTFPLIATVWANSVPAFPSMDLTGPWVSNSTLGKIFGTYPDFRSNGSYKTAWPVRRGTEGGFNPVDSRGTISANYLLDPVFRWSPTSANAKYMRNWLERLSVSYWGYYGMSNFLNSLSLIQNDPRIGSVDYTTQPHQYLFQASSAATCATLTGWPCPVTYRGDVVISRTGFSSPTDTLLYYGSRTWVGDHDTPENGTVRVYKANDLLNSDTDYPGNQVSGGDTDQTIQDDMLQFNGDHGNVQKGYANGTTGVSPIIAWASGKHGSWNSAYGDRDSQYAYMCSDLKAAYDTSIPIHHAQRCVVHFKKSGNDEFILQLDEARTDSPVSGGIATHIHYIQNGETGYAAYPEGHTSCPGGCTNLDTNRLVQSLEDGGNDGLGDPTRNFGVITRFLSPSAIKVRWDCDPTGDAECSPGSTYPGGAGHTDRVSICAGSTCGGSASSLESLIVHKIAGNLTDTTLTTTAINPDSNWTGVQASGATSSIVFVGARGGTTHSTMTGFTTTHSGVAQYLFGGLTPGTYTVTINSVAVTGSPFTVSANDNSIEFENTAGTVSINGVVAPASKISGKTTASGNVIIH